MKLKFVFKEPLVFASLINISPYLPGFFCENFRYEDERNFSSAMSDFSTETSFFRNCISCFKERVTSSSLVKNMMQARIVIKHTQNDSFWFQRRDLFGFFSCSMIATSSFNNERGNCVSRRRVVINLLWCLKVLIYMLIYKSLNGFSERTCI